MLILIPSLNQFNNIRFKILACKYLFLLMYFCFFQHETFIASYIQQVIHTLLNWYTILQQQLNTCK